ncbi:MAG: hypothetical protein CMM25_07170 [Rhodospirillaceae bacterium]|nr:hypothetical protein [Rhodospirillaceae bacterium]
MSSFQGPRNTRITQDWLNAQTYETLSNIAEMLWKTHTIKIEWEQLSEEDVNKRCEEWGVEQGDNIWHSRNRLRVCNDDQTTSEDEDSGDESGEESGEEEEEEETHISRGGLTVTYHLPRGIEQEMSKFSDEDGWLYGIGTLDPDQQGDDERSAWNSLEIQFYDAFKQGGSPNAEDMEYDDLHELAAKRGCVDWETCKAEDFELVQMINDWNRQRGWGN